MMRKRVFFVSSCLSAFVCMLLGASTLFAQSGPSGCVSMYPCTVLMNQPCSAAFFARDCIDLRQPPILNAFTPCIFGNVGACAAAPDEVVAPNTGYVVATGASSGAARACIVPNATLVCWKKRPCNYCDFVIINGGITEACTYTPASSYTNLQAFGFYELQGSCTGGGGGEE
jgi:hypothetical protein